MFVLDHGQGGLSFAYLLLHASGGGIYLEVAASVRRSCWLAGCMGQGTADAGAAMRELAAAGARDACVLDADGPSTGFRSRSCGRASGSSCAPGNGSPPTGKQSSASPRWTGA